MIGHEVFDFSILKPVRELDVSKFDSDMAIADTKLYSCIHILKVIYV